MRKCSSDIRWAKRDFSEHCSPVFTDVLCCMSTFSKAFSRPTIVGMTKPLVGCGSVSMSFVAGAKWASTTVRLSVPSE